MAMPTPIYRGTIDGKSINDYCKLDSSIKHVDDRIEYIKKLLNIVEECGVEFTNDQFLIDIWDKGICKTEINTDDFLWSETNIASTLEMLGSYILYADEEKDYRKQEDYKIYYDEDEFDKAIKRDEMLLNNRGRDIYNNKNGKSMKILIPRDNYKLVPKEKINNVDIFKHPIIGEYKMFSDYLKVLRDNPDLREELNEKKGTCITEKRLKKLIGFINVDMIDVKLHYHPHLKPKHLLKDDGYPSWDEFDEFCRDDIKALLQVHRDMELTDFQNDVTCMVYDLNQVLKRVKLTDTQRTILTMWQQCMNQYEIATKLEKSQQFVSKTLNAVADKIIKVYEEDYSDWYYLNVSKGVYKTCSCCGETKLVSKFSKMYEDGDRYRPECNECRKNKNKGK